MRNNSTFNLIKNQLNKNVADKSIMKEALFSLYSKTRQIVKHPLFDPIFRSKPVNGMFVKLRINKIRNSVRNAGGIDVAGMFSFVEIETHNRCNGTCSFCPVNVNADTREYLKMSDELFDKIITELQEMSYCGKVSLHSNNEPFLDKRIENFIKKTRKALPNAFVDIYTNGSVLTLDRFKNVIEDLDVLVIDNYSQNTKMNPNVKAIYNYIKHDSYLKNKVKITFIKPDIVRNTRAGQSPNNKSKKTYNTSCFLPFNQLIIRPDGKLSLCCQDALGTTTMGDISKQTIMEVWNSDYYIETRKKLLVEGRKSLDICKYCDYFGHLGIVQPMIRMLNS